MSIPFIDYEVVHDLVQLNARVAEGWTLCDSYVDSRTVVDADTDIVSYKESHILEHSGVYYRVTESSDSWDGPTLDEEIEVVQQYIVAQRLWLTDKQVEQHPYPESFLPADEYGWVK